MAMHPEHRDGNSHREVPKDENSETAQSAYGQGPFTKPLPRPTGCWAGCIRTPCCLTNRVDRREDSQRSSRLDWSLLDC